MESSFFNTQRKKDYYQKNEKRSKEAILTSMLPRSRRLVSDKDYKEVYKFGSSVRGKFFKILFLKTNNEDMSKAGVVVSNKVSKKATERNRIKRVVRSFLRDYIDQIETGWKVVVVAGPEAAGTDILDLRQDLADLLGESLQ